MHDYSNKPLPDASYLRLLGKALYIFNNSNSYIIEKILHCEPDKYSWAELIDRNSGNLSYPIKHTIARGANEKIATKFEELVDVRNRIAHSFQIRDKETGKPILAARNHKTGRQSILTVEYLERFIRKNEEFVKMLDGCGCN